MSRLSEFYRIRRRYARSVNLERDLDAPDALRGYVPISLVLETSERILNAQSAPDRSRAWTLTGVYGTGKSAFAHFLSALYGPASSPARALALEILATADAPTLAERFSAAVPATGFVRAVATGRREPLAHTVVRALAAGAERFWAGRMGRPPGVLLKIRALRDCLEQQAPFETGDLPELVRDLALASRSGVLILLDELGKNFEAAARSDGAEDLFLLQQLAELPAGAGDPPILTLGLLHQAFSEYADGLAATRRSEWEKVHGRFEDVPFAESPDQMLRLMAEAIEADPPRDVEAAVLTASQQWHEHLRGSGADTYLTEILSEDRLNALFPLHPVAAAILPQLCTRYAQNERSLFTFLGSPEPHSLVRFLAENEVSAEDLPVLRVADIYDYFVDVAGMGLYARPQFQRWAEVHSVVRDAIGQDPEEVEVLKTVGTLNLVGSNGAIRASRGLVLAALVRRPEDAAEQAHWARVLDRLVSRGTVLYREQVDELRIWEGSFHDVSALVRQHIEADRRTLPEVLASLAPLPPAVAQRESYRTGTLRYFERQYLDCQEALSTVYAGDADADGVIVHWIGSLPPDPIPATCADGRPLVVVPARILGPLEAAARELAALEALDKKKGALQNDGVARREVRQRLAIARRGLGEALNAAFSPGADLRFWVLGTPRIGTGLNAALSEACFKAYRHAPVIWNELINRRDLTSQGARARKVLLEALLTSPNRERLGLSGHGPEVSMYASVLERTGIHRLEGEEWRIGPPTEESAIPLWRAIEDFCTSAAENPRPVSDLYALLQGPPYGIKAGMIPVFLAAVLLYHADDVSVYWKGSFLPILGVEHFDLLIKDPGDFGVKHFQLEGLRLEVFRDLELVVGSARRQLPGEIRNATVLSVVRPLTRFATRLPEITQVTRRVSPEARAVRDLLLKAPSPEQLLFADLPRALGFPPFTAEALTEDRSREEFRHALVAVLRELQFYYDRVLDECLQRIHQALKCASPVERTREDLRVRAFALHGRVIEPQLRAVVYALIDGESSDRQWLEAVLLIVGDKPVHSWSDEDLLSFELNLSDLATRFLILYSIQEDAIAQERQGFDARKIIVAHPGGDLIQETVWIDQNAGQFIREQAKVLLQGMAHIQSEPQRQAIAVRLLEEVFRPTPSADELHETTGEGRREHG
jgi:hypothetical protein